MRSTTNSTLPPVRSFPTPEEIERHVRNGRRLRAEAITATIRGMAGWLLSGPRGAVADVPARLEENGELPERATPLRSPLMAIRSSAEILRDNPDLTPAQRARFVEILLAEEQRLERLIARAFGGAEAHGR